VPYLPEANASLSAKLSLWQSKARQENAKIRNA